MQSPYDTSRTTTPATGAIVIFACLLAGCNLLLGTEPPLPPEAGGAAGSGGSGAGATGAAGGSGGSGATTVVCGDDGWTHWDPNGPRQLTLEDANQIVSDSLTGLRWEATTQSSAELSHAGAEAYCAALSIGALASGWRLPTRVELLSIVDYSKASPAVDTAYFKDVYNVPYWTKSAYVPLSGAAKTWGVYFTDGQTGSVDEAAGTAWVRCVHGTPPDADSSCERYLLTGTTATDEETGLVWQRNATSVGTDLVTAQAACAALALEQRAWRLPTIDELATLIDEKPESLSDPRFDVVAFPKNVEPNGAYWSSTTKASDALSAMVVQFWDGIIVPIQKTSTANARCVAGP